MQRTVLVVDDERNMLMVMEMALEEAGYRVLTAECAEDAMDMLRDPDLAVVLSDLKMPGMGGEEFIARCQRERPDVPVIVVTAFGSIRSAIECIQAGASDYLTKPFEPEELQFAVQSALRLHDLMRENRQLQAAVSGSSVRRRLVGNSHAMLALRDEIDRVAPYKTNVLITGESGTGKEAVARSIHENGPRAERPWVAINCSAIPRDLMESELFGYVRGAFTGAVQNRMGRLEQANGGTLFLDEIGDLDLTLQAKLLRVLQEREFSPVGSDVVRRVDLRVIAATHRDLDAMVREGSFREDLLYRLDVYKIVVPPLRDRREDIPLLADNFLQTFRAEMDKPVECFADEALAALSAYDWPGNVRELRNAVERSLLSCRGMVIERHDLPDKVNREGGEGGSGDDDLTHVMELGLDNWIAAVERNMIIEALKETGGVQVQAAKLLGISERSLWHRVKKLEIRVDREVRE
ncbi:MAG: sigma-54 dependent transcriptional regulator [Candidatus Thiodiazotropha sp.]